MRYELASCNSKDMILNDSRCSFLAHAACIRTLLFALPLSLLFLKSPLVFNHYVPIQSMALHIFRFPTSTLWTLAVTNSNFYTYPRYSSTNAWY
ncbi:hypothetical protein BDZ91DRAFT_296023 [Kalaharituber pfeilii]|nr:hypothetical protein BDZ91DRAFT_296023 [Kalaharituber pfeilii]